MVWWKFFGHEQTFLLVGHGLTASEIVIYKVEVPLAEDVFSATLCYSLV